MTKTISREINPASELNEAETCDTFPPRPKFSMIEHGRISPSPLNPRKHFAEDALAELAESLRVHGMQQPLVVRQHVEDQDEGRFVTTYSIVMGERRWRAAALAGMSEVPAIVRTDLDDLKHAELAMEENVRRRDLTVMEEANGYAKLQSLGKTQSEIGAGVGVSQSRIANLLRLRDLPADVQQMIEDGQLSTGHGIQLARYKAWPALCLHVAKELVRCRLPVKDAEKGLNGLGIYNADGILIRLSSYPHPAFDWKSICPACPFGAYLKEGNSQQGEHHYCLKPAHFAKLDKEARDVQREAANKEAEKLRQQAMERSRQAEATASAASTKTGAAQAQAEAESAAKASAAMTTQTGKPNLSKCKYGVIEEIRASDPPACQAGTCPCRCMAVSAYGEDIVPACADPKRMAKLKQAADKDKNKNRKVVFDEVRVQLAALPWDNNATETQGRRMMAMVAWHFLRNCKSEAKKQVAARLPETGEMGHVRELLLRTGYEVKETDAFDVLAGISPTDLLGITAEALLRDDLLSRYDYGSTDLTTTKSAWFLPAREIGQPSQEPRLYPCTDCKAKDAGAFWVDANGYEVDKLSQLGEWVCDLCQDKRKASAHAEQLLCAECREPLTDGAFGELDPSKLSSNGWMRMTSGELASGGNVYCHLCGPSRQNNGLPKLISEQSEGEAEIDPTTRCPVTNEHCAQVCHAEEPCALQDEQQSDSAAEWEYEVPPSLDKSFCRSCGVLPVAGTGLYCPHCDPLAASPREEAIHA